MGEVDESIRALLGEVQRGREALIDQQHLRRGGGGGTSGGVEERVTRLEVQMEHMREDTAEIKADLKALLGSVSKLATRGELANWRFQWLAIGAAILGLTITGIVGGLTLIAWAIKP